MADFGAKIERNMEKRDIEKKVGVPLFFFSFISLCLLRKSNLAILNLRRRNAIYPFREIF